MIVILCNSFQEAKDGFNIFIDLLKRYRPFNISRVFKYSYCVETDDGFRYIFVDYRFKKLALNFDDAIDYVNLDEFFEEIFDDAIDYVNLDEFFEEIDEYYLRSLLWK